MFEVNAEKNAENCTMHLMHSYDLGWIQEFWKGGGQKGGDQIKKTFSKGGTVPSGSSPSSTPVDYVFLQVESLKAEIAKKEAALNASEAKIETFKAHNSDQQQHISVLQSATQAKDHHIKHLQSEVGCSFKLFFYCIAMISTWLFTQVTLLCHSQTFFTETCKTRCNNQLRCNKVSYTIAHKAKWKEIVIS